MNPEYVRKKLLGWYATHRRRLPWRETSDPYAIWVSEVMLQQTQVATAIPYYQRFMDRFPTPMHLAAADIQAVLKLWEGLGYYSRARNLHRAAGVVVTRFNGQIPDDPALFRSLPGVGDYIAAAVLSIAFGRVIAVVDGNVARGLLAIAAAKDADLIAMTTQGMNGFERFVVGSVADKVIRTAAQAVLICPVIA